MIWKSVAEIAAFGFQIFLDLRVPMQSFSPSIEFVIVTSRTRSLLTNLILALNSGRHFDIETIDKFQLDVKIMIEV